MAQIAVVNTGCLTLKGVSLDCPPEGYSVQSIGAVALDCCFSGHHMLSGNCNLMDRSALQFQGSPIHV